MEKERDTIKDLIKEAGVESPSKNFLNTVMDQIEIASTQEPNIYQPLISNRVWWVLGGVVVFLIIVIPFLPDSGMSLLYKVNFSFLETFPNINDLFLKYTLHKTTTYGILFLGALFFIQVYVLKKRIDKNFSL